MSPLIVKKKVSRHVPPKITNIQGLIEMAQTGLKYCNIDTQVLWNILPQLIELDNMIGMKELKDTVFYQVIYYIQKLYVGDNRDYLHTAIMGPPGTGKTSVAKILGEMYKNMNILSEGGIFKIAKRTDFVAEYLGQTSIKTKKLLESCLGGVLFIDEVYALGPGSKDHDSFSKEAIDTINVFLSEHKNDFCCIIAGYEEDIVQCFFNVNKGLERRFHWIHRISGYSVDDMTEMFFKMVGDIGWTNECDRIFIKNIISSRDVRKCVRGQFKNFGGDIENLVTKCKMAHALRIFSEENPIKYCITNDDVQEAMKYLIPNTLDSGAEEPLKYPEMYS
jgi:SpoVK/Ycf46/Vps4 family AAA+-type ATPase